MGQRLQLHNLLQAAVGEGRKVYFQPPSDVTMVYPCIVYERARGNTRFAGNLPYLFQQRYTVTVIDRDPDSEIPSAVAKLPMTTHSAFFVADNLNHDVFDINF